MNAETKLPTTLDALSRLKTGEAKRDQIMKIQPSLLEVESGFNVRGIGMSEEEYWSQPHVVEHVENLALAYKNGEQVPNIVVKFSVEKQRALIRDGHHRHRGLLLAIERGAPIQYIKVDVLSGDESKQQLLMLKSGNSLQLSAVEKAEIMHRLRSYGFDTNQIAEMIGKSVTHVTHLLKVYDLPIETKRLIQQGKLSINSALTPKAEKEKVAKRKANRKATNSIIDLLIATEEVSIEENMAQISIPLELWEAFKKSQLETVEAKAMKDAEKEFNEKQVALL